MASPGWADGSAAGKEGHKGSPDTRPPGLWDALADITASAGAVTGRLLSDRYQGEPELRGTLISAVTAHATRSSGRAVHFPGWSTLTGTLTVGQILARSVIDEVRVLDGATPNEETPVMTRDFVRPRWSHGRLVLPVHQPPTACSSPSRRPPPPPAAPITGEVPVEKPQRTGGGVPTTDHPSGKLTRWRELFPPDVLRGRVYRLHL